MDDARFDRIARSLAAPATRRAALALPTALGLARLLAAEPAAAKPKKKKSGCPGGTKRCGTRCIPKKSCCTFKDCDAAKSESCVKGRCRCAPGEVLHNGACGEPPTCKGVAQVCTSHTECCSFDCSIGPDDAQQLRCNLGYYSCYLDLDCWPGHVCRGYFCRKP